ncbi:hypothetical protein CEP54_012617 [Fusarium duplospermum]|uniref:Oxidoreductase n=1 Tax=Fusarium duplospermum TaxID=1325734 RepID=A0A428P7P4_9HYPO|nr:hypothetical protein CEP54_012617 [Fusarium duplospermum]
MTSKYVTAHDNPKGPGDARPTASQIIADYDLEGKLSGKVILITGCSSGIGVETARAIYRTGATVYATARDIDKAKGALHGLTDNSVRTCADTFKSKSNQLDILIENAGVRACPEGRTADGFETQFGTNHLGDFMLFYLLKDVLLRSSTAHFNSRAIILSSCAHQAGSVHFDNLNLEGEYEPWKAYGQSKAVNLWTAREIEKRFGAHGLHAWVVHSGSISTELQPHVPEEIKQGWETD